MRILIYIAYCLLVAGQVLVTCFVLTQRRWNCWRRYGQAVFFGLGAVSSASLAPLVFGHKTLTISLVGGVPFYTSIPRSIALMCYVYGLYRARRLPSEDIL